jgi:hypothetical protein
MPQQFQGTHGPRRACRPPLKCRGIVVGVLQFGQGINNFVRKERSIAEAFMQQVKENHRGMLDVGAQPVRELPRAKRNHSVLVAGEHGPVWSVDFDLDLIALAFARIRRDVADNVEGASAFWAYARPEVGSAPFFPFRVRPLIMLTEIIPNRDACLGLERDPHDLLRCSAAENPKIFSC